MGFDAAGDCLSYACAERVGIVCVVRFPMTCTAVVQSVNWAMMTELSALSCCIRSHTWRLKPNWRNIRTQNLWFGHKKSRKTKARSAKSATASKTLSAKSKNCLMLVVQAAHRLQWATQANTLLN